MPHAPTEEFRRLALLGRTVDQIAAATGVTPETARRRLSAAGIMPVDGRSVRHRRGAETLLPEPEPVEEVSQTQVDALRDDPRWPDAVRDYRAGDSMHSLAKRYGAYPATVRFALLSEPDIAVRDHPCAQALFAERAQMAMDVLYRLRTGALEDAAQELGVGEGRLREVLDRHGLLPHDYDDKEEFDFEKNLGA